MRHAATSVWNRGAASYRLSFGIAVLSALAALIPPEAAAQTGANVLVVINANSETSVDVGEYYARQRLVPAANVVRIQAPVTEGISRVDFERTIRTPIALHLLTQRLQDQVLFIVLTKGVPIRVEGTGGTEGTVASVDSELTLLYRFMLGEASSPLGRVDNPHYLGSDDPARLVPMARGRSDIYLVTRLDGFNAEDAKGLVDRAMAPTTEGSIVLDQRGLPDRGGERWLQETAGGLEAVGAGGRTVLETTRDKATVEGPVLGYYSWGSNDPANRGRRTGLRFARGALAGMFVSTDGRTFETPPDAWSPSNPATRHYGTQSLAGDLVREGVTGVSAHVSEPYLDASVRPQILFRAYLGGATLAEAYYAAMPYLSWQTIVIGDPLCAPFRRTILPPSQIAEPIDDTTDLPAIFSRRSVARSVATGVREDVARMMIRAESLIRRGDPAGAEPLLAEVFKLDPRVSSAGLRLAGMYEARGEHELARKTYEGVLSVDGSNVIALNNLAYSLAVHGNEPAKALPLARRAAALGPLPEVLDTLGWVQHLTGAHQAAAESLESARERAPENVEVRVHLAAVYLALGDRAGARRELDQAEKLQPALADRDDVKSLRAKVGRARGLRW